MVGGEKGSIPDPLVLHLKTTFFVCCICNSTLSLQLLFWNWLPCLKPFRVVILSPGYSPQPHRECSKYYYALAPPQEILTPWRLGVSNFPSQTPQEISTENHSFRISHHSSWPQIQKYKYHSCQGILSIQINTNAWVEGQGVGIAIFFK